MFRYVIAIWDQAASESNELAIGLRAHYLKAQTRWTAAHSESGMFAFFMPHEPSGNRVIALPENSGAILGRIYRAASNLDGEASPVVRLTENQARRVMDSQGRCLISDYWGSYVLVMRQRAGSNIIVMRSPMSQLPCFEIRVRGVVVLFSCIDDILHIIDLKLTINWESLTGQAAIADHLTGETCLNEISAIDAGECVIYRGALQVGRMWQWAPAHFQQNRFTGTFEEAARELRHITEFCVRSWASDHRRVLVTLSGGLDSSIVLACLRSQLARPNLSAVNFYSRFSGDERRFARCMADAADCDLVELPRNDHFAFHRFLECAHTVRPVVNGSIDAQHRALVLADAIGATAAFSGELGDNVFGSNLAIGMLLDCFRDHGVAKETFTALIDYALLSKQSIWRSIRLATRERMRLHRRQHFSLYDQMQHQRIGDPTSGISLVHPERLEQYLRVRERFIHPWKYGARTVVAGARDLLEALILVNSPCAALPFSSGERAIRVSPLISQPLVEFALRLPPYLHIRNAQNRSMARAAFSDVLPTLILDRGPGKGGPHLWIRDYLKRNEAHVREFLIEGLAVARRLLDASKISAALSPRATKMAPMGEQLLDAIYIESWLRKWDAVGVR